MSGDPRPMVWAMHYDDERSKKVHAFWYRFETHPDFVYFTFKRLEDIPKVCECGNKFYPCPK